MIGMRALLISALAATLIGCASLAPPQAITNGCSTCSDPTAAQLDPKPIVFKADAVEKNARSTIAANTQNPPTVQFRKKSNPVARRAKYTTAAKIKPLPSVQLDDKADPVIKKAKATIAATMENPASAEFREMRRAVRNALGLPIDTICGYVKGKSASGGDIGEKQFVYIVQLDEAYIVDDSGDVIAPAAYRYLCN
jgi:hypothetical protein